MLKNTLVILTTILFSIGNVKAQILKKLKDKANEKVENTKNKAVQKAKDRVNNKEAQADAKVDGTMDKGLDKVENVFKKKDKVKNTDSTIVETLPVMEEEPTKPVVETPSNIIDKNTINTKFDFKQGDKLVYYNDFSNDVVGEFAKGYTTNASGEIVTINEETQKWLLLGQNSNAQLENRIYMAKEGTIEFDMYHKNGNGPSYYFGFCMFKKTKDASADLMENEMPGTKGIAVKFNPGIDNETKNGYFVTYENGREKLTNDGFAVPNLMSVVFDENKPGKAYYNHISITRKGTSLKVYNNTQKILDLPSAFAATDEFDGFKFLSQHGVAEPESIKDIIAFANLKIANGLTTVKSNIATENKIVTNAIQFEVGKATILPTSYYILKEIAELIKTNKLKMEIVGHTDADGIAAKNLELSKQRAAATKEYLVKQFGVDATNLTTSGKGSTQLVDKATTAIAKANNRRVEFIKK